MTQPTPAAVSVTYDHNGTSAKTNELGMRPMQERAYQKRGEQYLLIKSPPASGKSRALMFIALDKLENQGLKQAIVVVPEKSIGSSFHNEPLSNFGFFTDWHVQPRWNLCDAPGTDGGKVKAVKTFLDSDDQILICTHASFRFAVEQFGIEAFDDRLIAIDEFHHISANPDNKLGEHVRQLMSRDKTHLIAMTGSYFRGDAAPVLHPDDEARFETVTYTYYEQLNGYQYLKQLDLGYYFYSGEYSDEIMKVLDPKEKTILHIPNVNSRESTKDKIREVEHILEQLGEWQGTDPNTGFQLVKTSSGKVLKIADLVDDDPNKRDKVINALKDSTQKHNRDHVDIIIALGMAKEGFDWIWCEHALTVGYRASLTEIVQIIGRATRDAPEKSRARFSNLIAEPDASDEAVNEAVNDTLKAIAASLLMEQVIAPRMVFRPKNPKNEATPGFDYGENGYQPGQNNVGINPSTGQMQIEIKGLKQPKSPEATRICREDVLELSTALIQDKKLLERGTLDTEIVPEEITDVGFGKIVKEKYPELDDEDQEAVRQHAISAFNLVQQGHRMLREQGGTYNVKPVIISDLTPPPIVKPKPDPDSKPDPIPDRDPPKNTALIDGVRQFALSVTELDVDLIDRINPFGEAYAILAKTMNETRLKQMQEIITAKKVSLDLDTARTLAKRALEFKQDRGRLPVLTTADPWERLMAEGLAFLMRKVKEEQHG
ncbi:MAG: DEAD/DEAH box helicase [Oscillatoriales cyanobacterium]|nr:MAG: DEAD/DEAH box helicase [Oscillatoriales cyanobacterium]